MKKTSLILAILMFFCTIGTAQPSRLPAAIGRLGKFLKPRPVKPISPGSLGRYTEELYNLRSIPNPGVLHLDPKTWDNTFDKLPYGGSSSKGFPRRIEPSASPFYRTYPTGLSVTSREALSQIRWSTPSIEYIMAQGMEFYKAWFPIKLKKHTIVQQEFLYTVGYYDGKIDGKRDAVLTQAIKEFNQNHGFSLSDHFAPEIDPELSRIKLGKNPLLDEAIAQFKRNPKHPLHKHYESKDSAAFSTLTLQKNLDAYALLFNQLGHSQLTAGAQLAELKGAIAQFQKAQQLPVSGRIDEATATKIEAIFDERARKLKVFGKLSTQEEDADAISAALAAYGKTYQKESVLDAEEVLEKNWKDKTLEFIELGFELTEDVLDLFDLIQTALDYLEEDKNEVQYARIEPYLQQERAFVDYILGAQNLPCELNVITQNDYTFRYLDLGARKLVLRKRAKDWEMLELDVQNNTVRKRVKGEIAVQKFEEVCVLLLAVRSTDSLSYIYISPYPTATQQLRVQLGKETLWFDLKQGKLSSSEMDTLLKAYFLHTSHSVLIQTESETLKDSTVSQLKVDPRVLQQIQQSLNVWAAEAQQSLNFITCLNEQYSNIQSLPKVKTSKDIAVHTGKNLDEKGLKSLQKLLKKLEKAAKKSHEDSESSEASVEVWVGNESTEEWALYLDSMALQGALKGKHLLVFAGQVPGSTLLPVIAQHQVGLSSVTIFPEPVPTEIAISLLKALYKLMDNPARKSVLPQEELLWQSIEQALVKVPVDKRMSWAGLKYFQVHRL